MIEQIKQELILFFQLIEKLDIEVESLLIELPSGEVIDVH